MFCKLVSLSLIVPLQSNFILNQGYIFIYHTRYVSICSLHVLIFTITKHNTNYAHIHSLSKPFSISLSIFCTDRKGKEFYLNPSKILMCSLPFQELYPETAAVSNGKASLL